jgi:3-hydroxyisobutyrate dehydrogenase-like beta-hydroxyacid dehydrogenase
MSSGNNGQHIGFIGLGKMGGPIAARLIGGGNRVTVYDIDAGAIDAAVKLGAYPAASPKSVADEAAIVFLCLPALDAIRDVALGANGVGHGSAVEILVDCSTTGPEFATHLGIELAGHGITLLDSPVSGGVKRAREGKLALIMSGDRAAFDRVAPLVAPCGRPYYMGEKPGLAQMMKLVNNLLSQIGTAATYEAFVLGAKAGLDPDAMADVINNSTGMNNCTLHKIPRSVLPRTFDYGSSMEITYKDITLCMKEADRLGVTMLLGNTAKQMWGYGVNHGGAKRDSSTLITYLEEWAGVKVVGKAGQGRL